MPMPNESHLISEYMLGDDILVAPVVQDGAVSRDIYLPRGVWVAGDGQGQEYVGPVTLTNYAAPLNVVPYFFKKTTFEKLKLFSV